MKLSEFMTNFTPEADYEGTAQADDMVLAVGFGGSSDTVGDYIVAQKQISEHSGALEAQTQDAQYIRTGKTTTKTGTARTITINGDRYHGDAFQDAMLAHDIKYGKGSEVIKPYVYFDVRTGKGEKGTATIIINSDIGGAAGENQTFDVTMTSTSEPAEYTYSAT